MDDAPKPHSTKRKKSSAAPEKQLQPELVPDAGIDPERREKIEKIKQALADGTYRISNEDVARKLIDHMIETQREPSGESKS
jgi:anti-sigma28 factor (negative regulator of flagellin synthesis)